MSSRYGRYTKRGLLEIIADQGDRLLSRIERVLTVTTEESVAFAELVADVQQIGVDLEDLTGDAEAALAAKDNIIQQQANQITTLQQQVGVDAATIAANEASLQQQKDAAAAASAELVSKLTDASTTLKGLDATIVTKDAPINRPPTDITQPPAAAQPPTDTAPINDTGIPTDSSPA